jgi:hypothetical protein
MREPRFPVGRTLVGPAIFLALVTMIGVSNTARAQNLSAASIDGTVTDATSGALPGVTVTAASPALQVQQLVDVTDAQGKYRFPDLPRGEYQLRFELQGFKPFVRAGLLLNGGFAMRVDAAMTVGDLAETITVTGDAPLVDLTSTRGGQTIATEQLVTVLPGNKTVADLVNMTPGLRNTAGENPGTLGQNARPRFDMYGIASGNTNLTMMVDGFSIIANNPVPDVGSTAEVSVNTFGNTADIKEVGVAMNMILKSGGNTFHGSGSGANLRQYDDNVTPYVKSRNLTVGSKLKYFNDFGGDLGGRIVRNKLWFYGSTRHRMSQISQPGLVLDAGPDGKFLTGDEPPAFPKLHSDNLIGKLSYQVTQKYSLSTTQTYDKNYSQAEIQNQSYTFVPFKSTGVLDWEPRSRKGEFKGTPTSKSVFDVQFGKSGYHIYRTYQPSCDLKPSSFDNTTQLYDGCRFLQYGDSNFNFWVADANYSYLPIGEFLGGRHEIKTGYHFSKRNNNAIRPSSPAGDYTLVYDTVGGVPHQPIQITVSNAPVKPVDWDVINSGYVLDQFRLSDRLTLNLGLRFDQQHSYVPAQSRQAGTFAAAANFPRVEVGRWNDWAPRLAASWDITGNGKTVLKTTWGRFNQESSQAGMYDQNASCTTTYRWSDPNHNGAYDAGELGDFLSTTCASTNTINRALQLSHVQEVATSLERALNSTTAFRVLYLYRRFAAQDAVINVARPYSAYDVALDRKDPGPDGIFGTADDGGTVKIYEYGAAYAGSAFVQNLDVNRPKGRDDWNESIEGSFNKRSSHGWAASVSYTATRVYSWTSAIAQSPNDDYFPVSDNWRWSYKINGTYTLPFDITTGGIIDVESGPVGTRTYQFRATDPLGGPSLKQLTSVTLRMEPGGSQHEKPVPSVNVRAGRRFRFGEKNLQLSLDVLNVINSSAIKAATYVSGPTFGTVTDIMTPRQYRLGAAFTF